MTDVLDQTNGTTAGEPDLAAEVQRALQASTEPLTLAKIRTALPAALRRVSLEDLSECLRRQVAANVLQAFPRYRSQHERYWDRPMQVHLAQLLRTALSDGPLAWSELRRKLPVYAQNPKAESLLEEQVEQGLLHRHPPLTSRGGPRYGLTPPDPRNYLRIELANLFQRMTERFGFSPTQLRAAAFELLREEEWGPTPTAPSGEISTGALQSQPPHPSIQPPHPSLSEAVAREEAFADINPS
jgi:hypothetical protein